MNFNNHDFRSRFRAPRPLQSLFSHVPLHSRPRPPMLLSDSLLLPCSLQPPPMFGPRGATIPPKFYNKNSHIEKTMQNLNDYDEQHWCETCDRGFRTSILLENHKMEHQRCNIDGCTFVAHPKVITKHIQMQHSTGLYNKISKLNDPEEIKKWREERRMKFPTRANVDKKNAAVKEKIERGEKMGLKKTTFPGNSKSWRPNTINTRKTAAVVRRRPKKVEKACPLNKAKHNLAAFTGINQLNDFEANASENNFNFVIDDEMDDLTENTDKNACDSQAYVVCGAINNLIANYGSSDEEDGNLKIDNSKINNQTINSTLISTSKHSLQFTETETSDISSFGNSLGMSSRKDSNADHSDDSSPEEIKTTKTKDQLLLESNNLSIQNSAINKESEVDAKPTKSSRVIKKQFKSITRKLPSTLLEKLLSNEIRHERNVTLQCIRHIIKNNYFEK